jgi:anti-sigma factor RsiW
MNCCEEYRALLDPYVDGELEPQEALRVREHLERCPACQSYVDDAFAIRAAFPDVEDTEVPDGFAESVCAVIQAADTAPKRNRRRRWAKTLLPMAACCAIVVLLSQLPILDGGGMAATEEPAERSAMDSAGDTVPESIPESAPEMEQSPAALPAPEDRAGAPLPAGEPAPKEAADPQQAPAAAQAFSLPAADSDEAWIAYDNVVFASVVYLPKDVVGDALADFEGRPYSNANHPEEGVIGTGYALDQADFEHILYDVLDYPLGPALNQDRTTELSCIVVTEDWYSSGSEPAESPKSGG